ncbi:MAG: Flp family type IVb pilin [Planctomycetota bacterium]|jgi:Flp pilus assembly pilin Flp
MRRRLSSLWSDQHGQATIEYALLLAAVVLPVMSIFLLLIKILGNVFGMVTFMLSLPFP